MADLTQNIKYVVTADFSALDTLKTKIADLGTTVTTADTTFRKFNGILSSTQTRMHKLTGVMNLQALAFNAHKTTFGNLATTLDNMQTALYDTAKATVNLSTNMRMLANSQKAVTAAKVNLTNATKAQAPAVDKETEASKRSNYHFLRLFGTFQAGRYMVQGAYNAIKEGAQSLDLDQTLNRQIGNFGQLMADVRRETAGMVADADLKKSVALMTSFGISTKGMAEAMGLVQKMAVRTGQDAAFLTESFGRAISRRSILILDNLGIQMTLTEANEAYATSIGKTTQELTAQEKALAFQTMAIEKMKALTDTVDLGASAGGTVARAGVVIENAWNSIKEFGAKGVVALDQLFASAGASANYSAELIRDWAVAARDAGTSMGLTEDAWKNVAAVVEAMSKSEAVSDLLGDDGVLGTTPAKIQEMAMQFGQFRNTIDAWAKHAATNKDYRFLQETLNPGDTNGEAAFKQQEALLAMSAMSFTDNARKTAEQATAAYEAQIEASGHMLSTSQRNLYLRNEMNIAENRSAAIMKLIVEQNAIYADTRGLTDDEAAARLINQLFLLSQAEKLDASRLKIAIEAGNVTADAMLRQDAETARIKAQVEAATLQFETAKQLAEVNGGTFVTQLRMKEAQDEINQLQRDMAAKQAQFNQEQDGDIQKILAREMDGINTKIAQTQYLADYWKKQHTAEMAGIESFKNASDEVLKVEIARLETMAEQIKAGAVLLEIANKISVAGGGKATPETLLMIAAMQLEAANSSAKAIAMAKYLGETKLGPGGGSGKIDYEKTKRRLKDKEREYPDYLARLAEQSDIAISGMEKLLVPGNVRGGFAGESGFFGIDPAQVEKGLEVIREIRIAMAEYEKKSGGDKFMTDADLARLTAAEERMKSLAQHMKTMTDAAEGFSQVSVAMGSMLAGMDGIIGKDWGGFFSDMTSGLDGMSKALEKNGGAYELIGAAMPMVQAFTKNFIKDMRLRAGFEALMQGAAAWAAFAAGNIPGGSMHAIAATMYAGVAGGVIKLPKGKAKDDTAGGTSAGAGRPLRRDVHIHISGPIATTEAERGAMIRDAIRAADRQGI